jgi:hypothetical protein
MEGFEESEKLLKAWINNGEDQIIYTYQDWLDGNDTPNEFWIYDKKKSIQLGYEVISETLNQINESQNWAWDFALEVEIKCKKESIDWFLSTIEDLDEKKSYLFEEKKQVIKKIEGSKISKQDLILRRKSPDLFDLIDRKTFLSIKQFSEQLKPKFVLGIIEDLFFETILHYEVERYIDFKIQELANPELVEKLKNLPHKLCILYDLGILDLIEERFSYKNHKGTAPQTDKAKLISSLLEIDDPEKVRNSLRKKDFLSDTAIKKAIETLKKHGLEPKKLTD